MGDAGEYAAMYVSLVPRQHGRLQHCPFVPQFGAGSAPAAAH